MKINFISSTDIDKEHVMHSESDNIKIMINDEADKVKKEPYDSVKPICQNNLKSMSVVSLSSIMFTYCNMNVIK